MLGEETSTFDSSVTWDLGVLGYFIGRPAHRPIIWQQHNANKAEELQLMVRQNSRRRKCDLSEFDCGVFVGASWVSFFEIADLLRCSHTTVSTV